MNSEEDEFRRIEAEAKRRAARDEDNDTQGYASEAAEAYRCGYEAGAVAEREAIAKLADASVNENKYPTLTMLAQAIRMRGD